MCVFKLTKVHLLVSALYVLIRNFVAFGTLHYSKTKLPKYKSACHGNMENRL